jgi:hypothetical protein
MSQIAHRRAVDRERKRRQRARHKHERREQFQAEVANPDTPPLTEEEWRFHLEQAVRKGSVQAMKLWRELHEREDRGRDDRWASLDGDVAGR